MLDMLMIDVLAKPLWMWLTFGAIVATLLAFDLGRGLGRGAVGDGLGGLAAAGLEAAE